MAATTEDLVRQPRWQRTNKHVARNWPEVCCAFRARRSCSARVGNRTRNSAWTADPSFVLLSKEDYLDEASARGSRGILLLAHEDEAVTLNLEPPNVKKIKQIAHQQAMNGRILHRKRSHWLLHRAFKLELELPSF